ncbi:Calx-beta domain-containing protein [Leifsonia xyli]|uniref:Calx-beta domain-containing protein n=1 Tax=Leifsonia xyli TaxID=1575 RepID=UPI003D66F6D2
MSRPHDRLRLACALTLAAFGVLVGAGPAVAAQAVGAPAVAAPVIAAPTSPAPAPPAPSTPVPASPPAASLTPLVDCVQDASLGAVSARTVVLGYRSTADSAIPLDAASGRNDLTAGPADRGQPASFEPGEHHGVWLLTVDATAEPALGWRLGDTVVRFDAAPACTAATAVTLSAPAEVAAGAVASVSATVTRMLLAAPSTGAVAFSVDGGEPVTAAVSGSGVARADLPIPVAGAHTITATYRPAEGSGLLTSSGAATLSATAASAPLRVEADSVVAGSTSVLVTIARASSAGAATVDLMTADGTAHAGGDYSAVSTTVALADGQSSATVRIPLATRAPGSPAATFFVLLQRASTAVTAASATVTLPAVPSAAPAAALSSPSDPGSAALSSVLPPEDPTAAAPAATVGAAQDLALLAGGILLTGGGIFGVVGLVRAVGMRGARA